MHNKKSGAWKTRSRMTVVSLQMKPDDVQMKSKRLLITVERRANDL